MIKENMEKSQNRLVKMLSSVNTIHLVNELEYRQNNGEALNLSSLKVDITSQQIRDIIELYKSLNDVSDMNEVVNYIETRINF